MAFLRGLVSIGQNLDGGKNGCIKVFASRRPRCREKAITHLDSSTARLAGRGRGGQWNGSSQKRKRNQTGCDVARHYNAFARRARSNAPDCAEWVAYQNLDFVHA